MKRAILILSIFLLPQLCFGIGNGDICIKLNDGDNVVYTNQTNTLEIWIANDDRLNGASPAYLIGWDPAVTVTWDMGYGSHPPVNEEGRAIDAWNLPDLIVQHDFDNVSPDHILIGGAAMPGSGLPAGPSELCYTLQFDASAPPGVTPDGFCVEPYFYPPVGTWTFSDGGGGYPPDFCGVPVESEVDPQADPKCFDVGVPTPSGDVDCSGFVDIDDVVYLLLYIFGGGPPPGDPNDDGVPDC
jgi:hypothetical protein